MNDNEIIHRIYRLESAVERLAGSISRMSVSKKQSETSPSSGLMSLIADLINKLKQILRYGFVWYGYKVDVDHGLTIGLGDDDHTQYFLLAGRSGGQVAYGGTVANDDVTIESTSHLTKGYVLLSPGGSIVAIGTATPSASAALDISSTTKGFLPPRMTGAQVEAIATPATGLIVYATEAGSGDITAAGWWGFNGANWVDIV